MVTDWEHYAEQMPEAMSAAEGFDAVAEGYVPRPDFSSAGPLSEKRGQRLGGVWIYCLIALAKLP